MTITAVRTRWTARETPMEEENKSKNGYKAGWKYQRLPQKQGRGHLGDRQEILRDKGTPARLRDARARGFFPVYLWLLH